MLIDPVHENITEQSLTRQKGSMSCTTSKVNIRFASVTNILGFWQNNGVLGTGSTRTKVNSDKGIRYAY
jgi:hypothetical protein